MKLAYRPETPASADTFGALLYNIGTTAALSTCFDGVTFSDKMIKYLTYLPFLLGEHWTRCTCQSNSGKFGLV